MLGKRDGKRNYFATSHLMAKLLAVGHASDEGVYDYSRVKRWFKNVNIFEMDKIFVPINHGRYALDVCCHLHDGEEDLHVRFNGGPWDGVS